MKFHDFLIGCFFTLIINCIFTSKCDNVKGPLHELKLNGVKFMGSEVYYVKEPIVSDIPLHSANFTIEFSQNGKPSSYQHCDGILDINIPSSLNGDTEKEGNIRRFLMFECTLFSCQFKIEAWFLNTRTEGVKNLKKWNRSNADIKITCEMIEDHENKNIHWDIKAKLRIRKPKEALEKKKWRMLPLHSSQLDKFRHVKDIIANDAVSLYAITPFKPTPPGKSILFANEVISLDEATNLVEIHPKYVTFKSDTVYDTNHKLGAGKVEKEEEEQEIQEEGDQEEEETEEGDEEEEAQTDLEKISTESSGITIQVSGSSNHFDQGTGGQENQDSTVLNTNTFSRNQGIPIHDMEHKNGRTHLRTLRKVKKLNTIHLNIDYSSQCNDASTTECDCQTNPSSIENTNSSTIRTTQAETSASLKLRISFLYLSLFFLYPF